MIDDQKLRTNLRKMRANRGWSTEQVARKTGLSHGQVRGIENGINCDIKLHAHLVPLCKAYKCSVQMLIASAEEAG